MRFSSVQKTRLARGARNDSMQTIRDLGEHIEQQ